MYKSATRVNSAFLKRLSKQVLSPYRVFPPKSEPVRSRGSNALPANVVKAQSCFTGHHTKHSKKIQPLNSPSLLVQFQKKYKVRSCNKLLADGFNSASTIRSARMFSGKPNEKENMEGKNPSLDLSHQNQDEKKTGRIARNSRKKPISEADQNLEANNVQWHGHSSSKHGSEKRKKEPNRSAVIRQSKKLSQKTKEPVETSSSKNAENFDRLQQLKGKLIRKLGEKWLTYEKITDRLETFPYYINENTRDLLVDCIAARLKNHDLSMFGEALPSSSHLILLQGQPGTELYQEALIRAIARHLQVSLLVVDSNSLSAKDLKDDAQRAGVFTDERNNDDDEKGAAKMVLHAENVVNPEAVGLPNFERLNQMFGCPIKILDLKNPRRKFDIPWKVLRFPAKKEYRKEISRLVEVDNSNWADELKSLVVTGREDELRKLGKQGEELKKFWHDLIIGDHVRYIGSKATKAKPRDKVSVGQEGFVSSISDGLPWKVCVKFQGDAEEVFCDASELEKVDSSASDEAWLARFPELPFETLCKMVLYRGPVIVHFPDIHQWFLSTPSKGRALLLKRIKELLSKVNGPVAFIASRLKEDSSAPAAPSTGLDSMFQSFFSEVTKATPVDEAEEDMDGVFKVFKNIIKVFPPEELQLLRIWQKQVEEDKKNAKKMKSRMLLEESLERNCLNCAELHDINTLDLQLTPESAEDVVGWARNMMFYSHQIQASEGKLVVERKCLEKALLRLKALKVANEEKMSYILELLENEYEKSLMSSIVLAHEIGVKFDEIGALDDVKSTLKELIVLPLQRPELFRKGNLRKPCKGVLLFGPPGTGKTLVAKAVATEAGANFINVSASSITSKFYGDDEKLVRALFALARKLSPVVIFVDEVDSLLGARGGSSEHEAMRRIKNEFMAAWDGLQSKESEQILVFATTNRPFDLDDAVIRRLPRRLLVDLPNAENRAKILRIILANEDLDNTFSYEALATQTEGYSGSDLKNLCVAAAYTPVREFLEAEQQVKACNEATTSLPQAIRPLCLNDFLQAKTKVGASLAYDAASMIQLRQWNEQYGGGGSRLQKTFGFSH